MLLFEVMDKEIGLEVIYPFFIFVGILGFGVTFLRWPFLIPGLFVLGLLIFIVVLDLFSEIFDPYIYPYIQKESPNYIPAIYGAIAISLAMPIIGLAMKVVRTARRK